MAQRYPPSSTAPYFIDTPTRVPSPWATMTTPSPSPGPPPSPAVWIPHDWTPTAAGPGPGAHNKNTPAHARSLPLLPNASAHELHELQTLRTNTTFSPLPTHPEFLRGLQSHPMIIQRGPGDALTRSPSPSSSVELVRTPPPPPPPPLVPAQSSQHGVAPAGKFRMGGSVAQAQAPSPVPFPSDVRFASPSPMNSGATSPRPLPSLHGSQHSLRSVPSSRPSPVSSPDSAAALSSPSRNPVAMPRPRLPAMGPRVSGRARSVECQRHPVFYMQEGMVVVKVQESLYKIHRYLLEHHSDYFRTAVAEGGDALGRSDENALPLPSDVSQQGFACLLNFLYHGIYEPTSVSLADWVTILRVSTRLQCTKIRQYAIRELTARRASLPTIDAIVLAKEHDVPAWLGPAYAELVRRASPLGDDEAERLGARTAAQVARAREMLREEEYALFQQRRYGAKYVFPERPDEQLVARAVNDVFHFPGGAA